MTDLPTRSPDQTGIAVALPDNAHFLFHVPGGPVMRIPLAAMPGGEAAAIATAFFNAAWAPGSTDTSLCHAAVSVGRHYLTGSFDGSPGVAAMWLCIALDGTAAPGSVLRTDGDMILTGAGISGERARFRFCQSAGGIVDPAALGYIADGAAAGQEVLLNQILAAAVISHWQVKSVGVHLAGATVDVGEAHLDAPGLTFKEPEGGFAGEILQVRGSTRGKSHTSDVRVEGNNTLPNSLMGEYQISTRSLATGVRWGPDGQGNAQRRFSLNRLDTGIIIAGNTEKHGNIVIDAIGNDVAVIEEENVEGTPDSNLIRLSGGYNGMVLVTADNTSGLYEITHEARLDQGRNLTDPAHRFYDAGLAGLGQVIPEPGIYIRSGKFHNLKINEWRGMNGRVAIFAHKDGNDGFDTFNIDGIGVHNYGTFLWVNAGQRLSGRPIVQDQADGRANYASTDPIPMPAILIGRVYDAGGFRPVLQRCLNTWGYQIGNPVPVLSDGTQGLYPTKVAFTLAGSMSEEIDGVAYHPNSRTGFYPRNKTLLYVPQAHACSFRMESIDGNIVMGDDCQDNSFWLPPDFVEKGYDIDDQSSAYGNHVQIGGKTRFSHIGMKSWLEGWQQTFAVDAVEDCCAMPAAFDGQAWSSGAMLRATAAELAQISAEVNWKFKRQGALCENLTAGKLMRATGPDYDDPWEEVGGATTITPVAHADLAALLARMAAAPAAGTHWYFVYDRVLNALDAIWPAGDLLMFSLLGAHAQDAARLEWVDAAHDWTENGALTWAAGRGYTGDGATGFLSSAFDPSASTAAPANAWAHVHVLELGDTTNGDTLGSSTKTLRLRAAHTANNRAEIGTEGIYPFTTQFTVPRSLGVMSEADGADLLFKQFDDGELRGSQTIAAGFVRPLPPDLMVLKGGDANGGLPAVSYKYGDDTVMLVAFGRNPTEEKMTAMAKLCRDIQYWSRAF